MTIPTSRHTPLPWHRCSLCGAKPSADPCEACRKAVAEEYGTETERRPIPEPPREEP